MSQWPYWVPPEYEWIKHLRVGDVLRFRSGKLRIVRKVKHWGPSIPKTSVSLIIQRCSWTTRPYTSYNGNDLRQMGVTFTGRNVRRILRDPLSRQIERDFTAVSARQCKLHCCDVRGLS